MTAQPTAKLCPHCANSIALDALKCPYCNAELGPAPAHEWPERSKRSGDPAETNPIPRGEKRSVKTFAIIAATILVLALGGIIYVGQWQGSDRLPGVADNSRELQEKDQKIQTLEAELAKLREGNQSSSRQTDELKAKLEESQKDLAAAEKKLAEANREIDRLTSSRVASAPRPAPRSADPLPPPAPSSPALARRAAEPGVYETVRATTVHEEPSGSARVLTQIARATRVTVVRAVGEWLEVRSKHGNPPGFIRAGDAMFVSRAN